MKWEKKTLDQLGSVSRGKSKHRPRNDPKLFGGDYPFIQTADVKNANFYITEYSATYNEAGLSQSKLWDVGTLCITIAANIADTGILGIPACFPDSVMGFVPYDDISDVRFVKYCFDMLQEDCKQISQGTTQDNLSWQKLSTIEFPAPSIEIQRRIADILSAYDDLIENNQKQIRLLEEAAQRLYKEWFVDLRFPGHEHAKIIDGVPEGWLQTPLSTISPFSRGKTITKMDTGDGKIPVVAGGLEPAYYHNKSNTCAPVITVSGSGVNAGFVRMYFQNIWASDCSYVDNSMTNFLYFTFCFMKSVKKGIDNLKKGSAQPHVYAKDLNDLKLFLPTNNLLSLFEELVTPLFTKISVCSIILEQSKNARDSLLPKLMNGEINVEAIS